MKIEYEIYRSDRDTETHFGFITDLLEFQVLGNISKPLTQTMQLLRTLSSLAGSPASTAAGLWWRELVRCVLALASHDILLEFQTFLYI